MITFRILFLLENVCYDPSFECLLEAAQMRSHNIFFTDSTEITTNDQHIAILSLENIPVVG